MSDRLLRCDLFLCLVVSDPNGDVVIGTAVAAQADFLIVTGGHALLSVVDY